MPGRHQGTPAQLGKGALTLNVHFLSVSDGGFSQETLSRWGGAGRAGGGLHVDKPEYQWELFPSVGRPAQDMVVRMKESDAYKVTALGNIINTSTARKSTTPPTPLFEVIFNYGKIQIYPLNQF